MRDLTLPVTFRGEIVEKLLTALRQGESCSLIGVGSSGKSNVVRHLDRADVLEYYLGEAVQHVLNLYVNCTKLTETAYTARGLHCLILEVMTKAVKEAQADEAARYSKLRTLWKEGIDSGSDALARSNLEDALDAVFQAGVKQIFITLDHLGPFFTEAPASALKSLRALRDDYKGRIMYVTVTRRELGCLRDPGEIEDFLELVVPATTIPVGPYSEADATFMIQRLAARETPPRTFTGQEREWLLGISGRHAGLLRMIYKVTQDQIPLMRSDLLDRLRTHPAIVEECEKIWTSLEVDEQEDLEAVVSEYPPSGKSIGALLGKGVVQVRLDGTYAVFSPVFANFVVDCLRRERLPVQLLSGQQVKVNNHIVIGLSGVEYQLLSHLIHQYPKPVTLGQLLHEMFVTEVAHPQSGGPPERRLQAYLDTISRKLELESQGHILRLSDGRYRLHLSTAEVASPPWQSDEFNQSMPTPTADSMVEAYAVARIRNMPDDKLFRLNAMYHLEAGILKEIPPQSEFETASFILLSLEEVIIDVVVYAEDMIIEPTWTQQFTFRRDEESDLLEFKLTPTKVGYREIRIEFFYQRHWLAQIKFEVAVVEVPAIIPA
jgi:hypothetical protein